MHAPLQGPTVNRSTPRHLAAAAALLGALLGLPLAHAVEPGQPAPVIALPGPGGPVQLDALRGQVVFVDFWASWCGPCKQSFPWLNEMQAKYGPRGLRVLAVNVDRQRADADRFLAQVPARFAVGFDPQGDVAQRYAVKAMPSSVLVGADGRVLQQHGGFRDDDRAGLEAAIVAALAKAGR
jgi:cytochrome c biogenesis protein CcmG, thiol:disulfide interchange protein DsbE